MFKNILLALSFIVLVNSSALADQTQIDTSGLNQSQIHELLLKADEIKNKAKQEEIDNAITQDQLRRRSTLEEISAYAKVGQEVGQGIVSAAKEVGVAASDFAQTSVGKITIAVIIWKVVGKSILFSIFGILWLFIDISCIFYFFKKLVYRKDIDETWDEAGKKTRKITRSAIPDYGSAWAIIFISFIASLPGWIMLASGF